MSSSEQGRHVPSTWDFNVAPSTPLDTLIYASNLLGQDPRVTNFGGGNTSLKVLQRDPLTGQEVSVLWVKASGGDLGSAKHANFASLYLERLLALENRYNAGVPEDELVPLYAQCNYAGNAAAPSIDTPLHGFVPASAVSHMHSDAVISIAAAQDGEQLTRDIYGDAMFWLPWKRPGFELGLMLRDGIVANPRAVGAMMGSHGFICWADDWHECYELTLRLINQAVDYIEAHGRPSPFGPPKREPAWVDEGTETLARLLPRLRGRVRHDGKQQIADVNRSQAVLDFLTSEKLTALASLGTSCPDHFLRTKIRPLLLPAQPSDAELDASLDQFRKDYAAYYDRCCQPDSPTMRNPNPSVVLIEGVGMISFGKSAKEARVTGEFYRNAIEVMRGAEALSSYTALPEQEAFNIEYWQLEEAKLRRMPPEKELARQVILLIGAGPGIGVSTAEKLLQRDATVVLADRNAELVASSCSALASKYGTDNVFGVTLDITDRASVARAMRDATLRYGGIDGLINLAAVFFAPDESGRLPDSQWEKTYEINLVGSYIVADEAATLMRRQETGGSIVLVSSANAVVVKPGSVAYDTSKAAVNHLVRELAVTFAPSIRVNAVAPATVVAGSQMFPRDRVLASLAKYEIPYSTDEADDALRDRLAAFYAKRTLLKRPVTPDAVSDALVLLVGNQLGLTTGQVIAVDGGLHEAFLR
jgi:rhamnulose-1-phosphate aldolase/alcohol dehydrogenase